MVDEILTPEQVAEIKAGLMQDDPRQAHGSGMACRLADRWAVARHRELTALARSHEALRAEREKDQRALLLARAFLETMGLIDEFVSFASNTAVLAELDGPSGEVDDTLDHAENVVFVALRSLGCATAVDPSDPDDCASVAVEAVRALRTAGLLPAPAAEGVRP